MDQDRLVTCPACGGSLLRRRVCALCGGTGKVNSLLAETYVDVKAATAQEVSENIARDLYDEN